MRLQMDNRFPKTPPRLQVVFASRQAPIYFITFVTHQRRACLACTTVHEAILAFAARGHERGFSVGRFVIMPDHVHLFACNGSNLTLGRCIGLMKQVISKTLKQPTPHWQRGFFDHVLRSSESYSQKWSYVRENPVRAGLVEVAEDWPYQGEAVPLQM